MKRSIAIAAVALGFLTTLAIAQESKKEDSMTASGKVKTVASKTFTVNKGDQTWTFSVDRHTRVVEKGGPDQINHHGEMNKPHTITSMLKEDESVVVTYHHEKDGKLLAAEIRLL
jgi:hypothetical protein